MRSRIALLSLSLTFAACGSCRGTQKPAAAAALLERDAELATSGDRVGTTSFDVPVSANDSLVVEVTSRAFDPTLEVTVPGQEPLRNDDYAGSREKSRVSVRASAPGIMHVVVARAATNASGSFHIVVRREADGAKSLAIGATEEGTLGAGDPTTPDGRFVETWALDGPERGALELTLTTRGNVVPLAVVLDSHGRSVRSDGHGKYVLTEPGPHRIELTSPTRGAEATFRVALARKDGGGAAATLARSHHQLPTTPGETIAFGADQGGELGAKSTRLPTGEPCQVYSFPARAGQAIVLEMNSNDFDAYLMLVAPSGRLFENDDANGQKNSRIEEVLPEDGTYRVVATVFGANMEGRYALKFGSTALVETAAGEVSSSGNAPITGTLEDGDATLETGERFDRLRRSFTPGSSVRVRVASRDFDPYLILRSPSGEQLDNDDYDRSTRNAGLDIASAEAGQYTLLVTSYQKGELGSYTVTFEGGPGVARPPVAQGAAPTGSRVFGVFVGISDYPDTANDLSNCANDATKLAESFRHTGLLTTDRQVLLTDGAATVSSIRQAMRRMAGEVRQDDLFVFFYSGHGSQQANSRDSREIDGMDEALYLYDGPLVDDELGTLFDGIHGKLAMVALDSCYSGGFAKDVITRPGRVGFFSSEEDVESAVASQFQAGGYLSYFVRTGIEGEADVNPHDSVLTVGELEHFLFQQFARHASDVELAGAYQQLVVDRGAVRVSQPLFSYR